MKLWFRLATAILILMLVQHAALWAQEQQRFDLEGPFDHPVPLSDSAREALLSYVGQNSNSPKSEHGFLEHCAQEEGTPTKNIPASWFVASSVTLKHGGPPSLVVVSQFPCLWGAHAGPIWVLHPTDSGYRVIFVGRGDGLDVDNTRSNDYRDLELVYFFALGEERRYSKFCYREDEYQPCGQRTVYQSH